MDKYEKFWDYAAVNCEDTEKRFNEIHLKIIENAKKYLKKNDIVLDYGCAGGGKTLEVAGLVKEIQGIDISAKMIEAALRNKNEHLITNAFFSQKDIFSEDFKKKSFDAIFAFNILHLLNDVDKTLRRIKELLKPDGIFLSATPCLAEKKSFSINLQFLPFHILSGLKLIPDIKLFKIADVNDLIKRNGFNIIETEIMYQKMTGYFIAADLKL